MSRTILTFLIFLLTTKFGGRIMRGMVRQRETQTRYQAEDGRTFDTQEEAERYERVEVARRAHEEAEEELNRALAESYQTADGHPFKLGRDYYVVTDHIYGADYRHESFYWRECKINLDEAEPEIIRSRGWGDGAQTVRFPLSSLYWREANAAKKVVELRERDIESMQESVKELREKFKL